MVQGCKCENKNCANKDCGNKECEQFELVMEIRPCCEKANLRELESRIRGIKMDGVSWGESKEKNVVYDVNSLRMMCVFDADKSSESDIFECIQQKCAKDVQSVELVGLNKL